MRHLRPMLSTIAYLDRALCLLEQAKAQLLAPMPRMGGVNLSHACADVSALLGAKGVGNERAHLIPQGCNAKARKASAAFPYISCH